MSKPDIQLAYNSIQTKWSNILKTIWTQQEIDNIHNSLIQEYDSYSGLLNIFPPTESVFRCFNIFEPKNLRVVILGQDCYINKDEATGLAFAVPTHVNTPPSLRNVFKEIQREYGEVKTDKDLRSWASQGVLLLNSALTVKEKQSGSHMKLWIDLTDRVIRYISDNHNNIVFMLWGNWARDKKKLINTNKHFILEHTHPSPLSRMPFIGCAHFSKCNEYLEKHNFEKITW